MSDAMFAELVSCGFPEWVCQCALRESSGNAEKALEECLKLQQEQQAAVAELVDMGFEEAVSSEVVERMHGSLSAATDWLLTHPEATTADSRPAAEPSSPSSS